MKAFISYAKNLRKRSTDTEKLLWRYLKAKRFAGLKFRRQEPIGKYIVDFVCYHKRVIIECDGGQHSQEIKKDQTRDQWFKKQGYLVLRFWDNEILKSPEMVLEIVWQACQSSPSPLSPPIKGGEEL